MTDDEKEKMFVEVITNLSDDQKEHLFRVAEKELADLEATTDRVEKIEHIAGYLAAICFGSNWFQHDDKEHQNATS